MKKALLVIAAVIIVLVVVAVAAPFLIPVETYKDEIRKQVRAQTGRELSIAGDIDLSILPRTQLTVSDVAFSNAEWAGEPQMAELERLRVRINPFGLLSGKLQVESFVLEKPVIHLAVSKSGQPNWALAGAGTDGGASGTDGASGEAPPADGGAAALEDVTLQDVRLVDGSVTYTDMRSGERQALTNVNLALSLETLDQPFAADGSVTWNGESVEVKLETGAPRDLMQGRSTKVALQVDSQPLALSYDGQVTNAEPRKLDGAVTIDIPSLKGLAAWTGNPIEAREGALERFALEGKVSAEGDSYAFTAESLRLDDIQGDGALGVDLSGAKPYLKGRLDLARLDLTPYLPEPTEPAREDAGQTGGQAGGGGQETAATEWSDEPIDLSALSALDADFNLSVEGIQAREVKVGKSALVLALKNGRLQADLNELALYEGHGKGRIVVDAGGEVPRVEKSMVLEGVQAKPLLGDAAGFDRLEGRGALSVEVATRGRSQKAMVQALDGKGAIDFQDGAIVGINLAAMVRNVSTSFTQTGEAQKTDFAKLTGTFTIQDGVLRNDDLLLLNPLLRLRGEGTSDIAARTVDYRVTPKAVASLEGQGGAAQEKGIAVPVIIEGPWHDIRYRPDLKSIITEAVKDPEKIKETVETLKQGGESGIKGVLEGLTGQQEGGETAPGDGETTDPTKALKKLFGD